MQIWLSVFDRDQISGIFLYVALGLQTSRTPSLTDGVLYAKMTAKEVNRVE